jgi:hypothetical protein
LFLPGIIAVPILWLSDDLVLTFNLLLMFGMVISALGMYVLMRTLTNHRGAALLCGLFFSFASFRFVRLPHLQMQLYGFLPLALACTHRFFCSGRKRWAWGIAGFFLLQVLSGTYLAAISAVALGVVLAVFMVSRVRRLEARRWLTLGLAFGTVSVLLYPFVRPYLWVNRTLGVQWDLEGIGSLSATPMSYLASASRLYRGLVGSVLPEAQITDFLFPGFTLLVLGGVGVGVLATRAVGRSPRTTLVCYLGILMTGFVLSLGPHGPLYPLLYEHIVFFRGLRALTRFGLLPLLSLTVFSGFALSWWLNKASSRRRWATAVVVAAVFIAETTVVPLDLTRFEDRPPQVYRWLEEVAEPGTIVELPFRRIDTRYMFWSRHHRFRAMLNGDSGFVPQSHVWMREIFLRFPSADSVALLRSLDVKYAVVHVGAYRRNTRRLSRLLDDLETYRTEFPEVATFERDTVLAVTPSETIRSQQSGEALDTTGEPASWFDGDVESSWVAEVPVAIIEIQFEGLREVLGIRFHYGRAPRIPVTAVEIESLDERGNLGGVWKSPTNWPFLADLVLSLIEDPSDGQQSVTFEPIRTRSLKIKLHGYDGNPVEMTEIEILGPG